MRRTPRSSPRRPPAHGGRRAGPGVWVGGRFSLPAYVHEGEPFRPEVVIWLDRDGGVVRSLRLDRPPLDRDAIAASLEEAIAAPHAGEPGEPRLVRVADAEMAAIAREVLSPGVEVEVGPTDELAAVAEDLGRAIAAGPPPAGDAEGRAGRRGRTRRGRQRRADRESYLCEGRVRAEIVAGLFAASARLVAAAPWRRMSDDAVFAVDVPSLGLSGACLSVIGALDQDLGFVLFDSAASYEAFLDLARQISSQEALPRPRGYLLSLNLVRWGELPATMRREARAHGWAVSDPRGYPMLLCLDPDGVPRPRAERDYILATACAAALAEFCAAHGGELDPPPDPPETRRIATVAAGVTTEVVLTLPHPGAAVHADLRAPVPPPVAPWQIDASASSNAGGVAGPLRTREREPHEIDAGPTVGSSALPRVGRNEPCPCGSGRKFKRCHGGAPTADAAPQAAADERAERAARWHERDSRLLMEMFDVATLRFAEAWARVLKAADRLSRESSAAQLLVPWSTFHARLDDRPLVDRFLQIRGTYLTRADRAWLEAGRKAWMSVWEILQVVPGRSIALRDVLTGEERLVVETTASRDLARFDAILARVVSIDDLAVLCGVHPRVLKPRPAEDVVRAVRRRLRLRSKAVAIERMRTEETTRALITAWERAVAAETARFANMEVRNTDGHRLLFTTDRYRFAPERRDEVVARLATLAEPVATAASAPDDGVDAPSAPPDPVADADGTIHLSIDRASDFRRTGLESVAVCQLAIHADLVVAETNSRERADEMRELIERTCAGLVEHGGRVHSDPTSPAVRAHAGEHDDEPPPREALEQLVDLKRRHYEAWVDAPIPGLGGRTPREASQVPGGRREVAVLLREIESLEARSPEGQRLDVTWLWRELGVERPH